MKKLIAVMLIFIVMLSSVACGAPSGNNETSFIMCGNCFTQNGSNARFCSVCGYSLYGQPPAASESVTEESEEESTETEEHTESESVTEISAATEKETETETEDISGKVICPHCGEYTVDGFCCEKCGEGLIHPEISETEQVTTEIETAPPVVVSECNFCGGDIVLGNKRCVDCGRMSLVINGNPSASDVTAAPATNSYSMIKINDDNSIGFTVQRSEAITGSMMVDNPNFIQSEDCPVIIVLMRNYCACGRTPCDISYERCNIELFTSKSTNTAINVNYGYSERVVGEDRYISFISTDISSKGITGKIRGCGLSFNAVGEYLFDLCFVGFFETKEDALHYMDEYLHGESEDDEEKHPESICYICGSTKRDTQKSCSSCGRKSLFVSGDTEKTDLLVAPVFADAKDIRINDDKTFGITTGSSVTESGEILVYNPAGMTYGECPVIVVLVANYCDCGQNHCVGNESCTVSLTPGAVTYSLDWTVKEKYEPSSTLRNSYTSFIYDLSNYTNSVKSGKINDINLKFSTKNEMQFDICFIAYFESRDMAESFVDSYVEFAWN